MLQIILKRITSKVGFEIADTHSGFIPGKGTREGIFNHRTLIERYSEVNKDLYLCFIDYENAFDRVNHAKLIQCLHNI